MARSTTELIAQVLEGDYRAVARAISACENLTPQAQAIQKALYPKRGRAHVIGLTGAPGAGKSTLVDHLALHYRAQGSTVSILAIDPSSPYSGGAILGDRIRMQRTADYPDIFIRSMASRGALGGVSRATFDAITVLDAAGYDVILVETVGVGQGEVDIVRTAHSCVVVLVPGMGDEVQAFKAGVLEISDIFVINKCDREGADLLERDLLTLLSLAEWETGSWRPPIQRCVATRGEGVAEIVQKLTAHKEWLEQSGAGDQRRFQITRDTIVQYARDNIADRILREASKKLDSLTERCVQHTLHPSAAAAQLLKILK